MIRFRIEQPSGAVHLIEADSIEVTNSGALLVYAAGQVVAAMATDAWSFVRGTDDKQQEKA